MSWSTPRDWTTDEIVTSTIMNTHLRDQLRILGAGARVSRNAAQAIAAGTWTSIQFNTEEYDSDGYHSNVTNNSRLTIPAGLSGRYLLWGSAEMSGGGGSITFRILKNATSTIASKYIGGFNGGDEFSCLAALAAGDFVEFQLFNSAGAYNVNVVADYSPRFAIQGLGGLTA